jgi:2-methylcitrate dehydratase PrpD
MAATQALAEIVQDGVAPDAIEAVTASVPPPHLKLINHGGATGDRASFLTSLPYQMARMVLAPDSAWDASQSPAALPDDIAALMARIAVEPDEQLLAGYPQAWPARVSVATASGRRERTVTHVPGDPARPLSDADLRTKFHRLTAPALGEKGAREVQAKALAALDGPHAVHPLFAAIANICAAEAEQDIQLR